MLFPFKWARRGWRGLVVVVLAQLLSLVEEAYLGRLLVVWPAMATAGLAAEDFSPTDDVNLVDNPNGAWSYGWTQALGTEFFLHTSTVVWFDKLLVWSTRITGDAICPGFLYNPEDSEVSVMTLTIPPGHAALHPGQQNEQSVLRWTAPDSGECLVTVTFVGLDHGGGTTTDVHVLHNGTSIFDGLINGYLDEESFSDTISAAPDDTVDFDVGFGNGTYFCDTTGIDVKISLDSSDFFRRGDADSNGSVNVTDAIFTLNSLFLGGPAPGCPDAADADDDGALQVTDAIYLLNGMFLGGPQPPAPGAAACGSDPSEDALGSCRYGGGC